MPDLNVGKKMIKNRIADAQEKRGVDPTNDLPKTVVLPFRGDVRDLATLARIFDLEGIIYTSKSSLICNALHFAAASISAALQSGYKEPLKFTSTLAAEEYLEHESRVPIVNLRSGGRNKVNTLVQKVEENLEGIIEKETVVDEDVEKRADEILGLKEEGEKDEQ